MVLLNEIGLSMLINRLIRIHVCLKLQLLNTLYTHFLNSLGLLLINCSKNMKLTLQFIYNMYIYYIGVLLSMFVCLRISHNVA